MHLSAGIFFLSLNVYAVLGDCITKYGGKTCMTRAEVQAAVGNKDLSGVYGSDQGPCFVYQNYGELCTWNVTGSGTLRLKSCDCGSNANPECDCTGTITTTTTTTTTTAPTTTTTGTTTTTTTTTTTSTTTTTTAAPTGPPCTSPSGSYTCRGRGEVPASKEYLLMGDGLCFKLSGVDYADGRESCMVTESGAYTSCQCSTSNLCGCGTTPDPPTCVAATSITNDCSALTAEYCDAATYGSTHSGCTYCNFSSSCGTICMSTLSTDEKNLIVDYHNELRGMVARGEVNRGKTAETRPQYIATNMRKLEWDDELAEIAQLWANQCSSGHDSNSRSTKSHPGEWVVQNNAYYSTLGHLKYLKTLINLWYNEVDDFENNWINPSVVSASPQIGHYTAMMNAKTTHVGCGYVMYQASGSNYFRQRLICNYYPGGNFNAGQAGWEIYKNGTAPATDCPSGSTPNTTTGLCE